MDREVKFPSKLRPDSKITILPGTMDKDLNALNTRNVRKPETLPISVIMVTYAKATTIKSSQFHGSRRYVNLFKINPRAIT